MSDPVILLDDLGRPFIEGVMQAPHPVVPPFPPGFQEARSGKWPAFLHGLLKAHPLCIGCGRKAETGHHDKTFHEHPELELVVANIAIVCVPCHFVLCHCGDWQLIVDNALQRLARNLKDMAFVRKFKR